MFRRILLSLGLLFSWPVWAKTGTLEMNVQFPLGQLPAGWVYSPLGELERRLEDLPFEVKGALQRPLGKDVVSVFLVMVPVQNKSKRNPASQWQWIDGVFAPSGITPAKSYEMNQQNGVGSGRRWSFREVKVSRAGVPMNIAAFRASQKYHDVFLVLREQEGSYREQLPQIKDLVRDLKMD